MPTTAQINTAINAMVRAHGEMTAETPATSETALLELGQIMDTKPQAFTVVDVGGNNSRIEYAIPDSTAIVVVFDTSVTLWRNRAALDYGHNPLMTQFMESDYGVLL